MDLLRFWRKPKPAAAHTALQRARDPSTPRYPPIDRGLPVAALDDLLDTHEDLIRKLRLIVSEPPQRFDALYLTPLRRLLAWVHLLPASRSEIFIGPGGLARLCLQMACACAQSSEGLIFSGSAGIEARRSLEPRWRYAAFLAGLLCELWRAAASCRVVLDDGAEWPSYQRPLLDWLNEAKAERYFVRWMDPPLDLRTSRGLAAVVANRIIDPEVLDDLGRGGSREIVEVLLGLISGAIADTDDHPLARTLRGAQDRIIQLDRALRPDLYGAMSVGVHLEPHLMDAMRGLVRDGTWKVNEARGRLWYAADGLFLVWRTGHDELQRRLTTSDVRAAPRDEQTVREILARANTLMPHPDGTTLWEIRPRAGGDVSVAVRFRNPAMLLGDCPVQPLAARIVVEHTPEGATPPQRHTSGASGEIDPRQQSFPLDDGTEVPPPPAAPPAPPVPTQHPVATDAEAAPPSKGSSSEPSSPAAPAPVPASTAAAITRPKKSKPSQLTHSPPQGKERTGLPKDLAHKVNRHVGMVLTAMSNDWATQAPSVAGKAAWVEQGFAFDPEWPATLGIEPVLLIEAAMEQRWLVTDPDHPRSRAIDVTTPEGSQRWVVLRPAIADQIGFARR